MIWFINIVFLLRQMHILSVDTFFSDFKCYFLNFLNVLLQIWAIKDIATTSAKTRLSVPMTVVSMMHFMNLSVQRSFLPQRANSVHACPPKVK